MRGRGVFTKQRLTVLGLSFGSQVLGWLYGHVFIVTYTLWDPSWQPRNDELSMIVESGVLTLLGYLFVVLPLVTVIPAGSRFFAPVLYVPVGALGATLFFMGTAGWWILVSIPGPFYLQAIVVGASSAFFHSAGLRLLRASIAHDATGAGS